MGTKWSEDDRGASPASGLAAEVRRLREREARHLELLEASQRREERSRAFMLALGALSASDTLYTQGLDAALGEIAARARRELGVARTGIWLFDVAGQRLDCAKLDQESAAPAEPNARIKAAAAPAYFAALGQARVIAAEHARRDARTRELDATYLAQHDISSLLDAPVRAFGAIVGVVCHEQVGAPRKWTDEEQSFAAAVGDLVALAIVADGRERAEAVSAASAARYRYLVESLPVTVYSHQPDAPVLDYLSPRVEALTGYPPAHWLEGGAGAGSAANHVDRWLEAVHPEDRSLVRARFARAPRTEDAADITYRLRHCDGDCRWVHDAYRVVRNADGQPLGIQGVLQDVTEAVRAQRTLDELRRQVHELVERSDELVVMLDDEGRVTFANGALARFLGTPASELRGKDWFEAFIPADEREAVRALFFRDTRRGTIVPWFENTVTAADGSKRLLRWNNVIRFDGDGRVVGTASLGIDLTERLAVQTRQLEAQKYESLGRLAAGVAHDFRNLLTAVMGSAEALEPLVRDTRDGAFALDTIREASRRATTLIASLVGFARQRPVAPQIIDLDTYLEGAVGTFRALLGPRIALAVVRRAPGARVRMDPSALDQVVLNLLVNARDAMPKGGTVQIETDVVFVDEEHSPALVALRPGIYVTIVVRDEGVGMNDAVAARVFEPFFTTKEKDHGTGLGLATSHGIVRQAGGDITVATHEGAGSTFTVYLPREASTEPEAARA